MSDHALSSLAHTLGAIDHFGEILVPAERMKEFLIAVGAGGIDVPYVECLFVSPSGTRPSLEYSAMKEQFAAPRDYTTFIERAIAGAVVESSETGEKAFFQVGLW